MGLMNPSLILSGIAVGMSLGAIVSVIILLMDNNKLRKRQMFREWLEEQRVLKGTPLYQQVEVLNLSLKDIKKSEWTTFSPAQKDIMEFRLIHKIKTRAD